MNEAAETRPVPHSTDGPKLLDAYAAHSADLRRLLAARAGEPNADDLMQELYLKVAAIEPTTDIRDPLAYLFRLAFNLASDWRRSGGRRGALEDRWSREGPTWARGEPQDDEPDAEQALAGRQELARVLDALASLPPRTREIFAMHKLQGLSYAEVAARCGVSTSAVEKHMMRALARLSQARLG